MTLTLERTRTMKILVSDEVGKAWRDLLPGHACEVVEQIGLKPAELAACIADYDGLIVRSATKVTAELLARANRLKVVARAGVGVDNVDLEAATERGVVVMNTPDGNTISAAEHSLALLLALARNIPQAHACMKAGGWERGKFLGCELRGKTAGIIGLGKIGACLAQRLAALELRVLAHDPFLSAEQAQRLGTTLVPLERLYAESDFISVHVPLNDRTRGLVGREALAKVKRGVRILNVARGGIIDEQALLEALESGAVAGAALDVFGQEPPGLTPLVAHPRVIVTPHLGASTVDAQETVGLQAMQQVLDFLERGAVVNAVNTLSLDAELAGTVRPYVLLAQRLGRLHGRLLSGQLEQVHLEFQGELLTGKVRELLTGHFLVGLLETATDGPVHLVNAARRAQRAGIRLTQGDVAQAAPYTQFLRGVVRTRAADGPRARSIAGSLHGLSEPVIVAIDQYATIAFPQGQVLMVTNKDVPGMLGAIATELGNAGINIANNYVGRDSSGGTALALFNLDTAPPAAAVERLARRPGILSVDVLNLA